MKTHLFYNELHLGDCLLQCRYFQKVAPLRPDEMFIFVCGWEHHSQLQETIEHLPNVALKPLTERRSVAGMRSPLPSLPPEAINTWIDWNGDYGKSPFAQDYIRFYLWWFKKLSIEAGLPEVFTKRSDIMFDYPALLKKIRVPWRASGLATETVALLRTEFDFLVVNSSPRSGQFTYKQEEMDELINLIAKKHSVIVTQKTDVPGVECTADYGSTVTSIGNLSIRCQNHICINTGPAWPTYNLWNFRRTKFRASLHDWVRLDFGELRVENFTSIKAVVDRLEEVKLL